MLIDLDSFVTWDMYVHTYRWHTTGLERELYFSSTPGQPYEFSRPRKRERNQEYHHMHGQDATVRGIEWLFLAALTCQKGHGSFEPEEKRAEDCRKPVRIEPKKEKHKVSSSNHTKCMDITFPNRSSVNHGSPRPSRFPTTPSLLSFPSVTLADKGL